jgi:hypothetical protein
VTSSTRIRNELYCSKADRDGFRVCESPEIGVLWMVVEISSRICFGTIKSNWDSKANCLELVRIDRASLSFDLISNRSSRSYGVITFSFVLSLEP